MPKSNLGFPQAKDSRKNLRSKGIFKFLVDMYSARARAGKQSAPNNLQGVTLADRYQSTHKGSSRSKSGIRNLESDGSKMTKNRNKTNAAKTANTASRSRKQTKSATKTSFIDAVKEDLLELNIQIDPDTRTFLPASGRQMSIESVATEIEASRDIQGKDRVGRDRIVHALERLLEQRQELAFAQTIDEVSYDPNCNDQFDDLARIICGSQCSEDEKQFTPQLLRHVIWSMKRRLNRQRVDNPLLVNIYGQANCGKSKFLELLLSPLTRSLWYGCSHGNTLMNDERWARTFGDYYAIVLDELAGMKTADMAKLKNAIDTPFFTYRQMRSNSVSKVPNNAQLLGTSNHRLRDTFSADDNVRKYAEIDFVNYPTLGEQKSKVWEPLNAMDWTTLWKSVNEKCDQSPMAGVWNEFLVWTSNKCVKQTDANIWWSRLLDNHEGETLQASDIQQSLDTHYNQHQVDEKFRKKKNSLATMLLAAGCQKSRSSGKGTSYKLPFKEQSKLYIPDLDAELILSEPKSIMEVWNEGRKAA